MSPAPVAAGKIRSVADFRPEQRSHRRYPIALELDYRLLRRGRIERQGSGRTIDIGCGGVRLETNESLPVGRLIELMISWPFLL
jgi:hypothetical protein